MTNIFFSVKRFTTSCLLLRRLHDENSAGVTATYGRSLSSTSHSTVVLVSKATFDNTVKCDDHWSWQRSSCGRRISQTSESLSKPSAYLSLLLTWKNTSKGVPSISIVTSDTIRHALVPLILLQKPIHQFHAEETGIKPSNLPHNRVILQRIS